MCRHRLLSIIFLSFFSSTLAFASDFVAPDKQLRQYNRLTIGDISLSYLKEPSKYKHKMQRERNYPLSESRLQKLKTDISKIVMDAFTSGDQFTEATTASKGTLKIDIALKDVRITTPTLAQKTQPGVHNYTQTPIHVTLEAELKDSLSGELIAKFTKKRVDSNRFNYFYRSSKARDDFEIKKLIRHWANKMHKKIDKVIAAE